MDQAKEKNDEYVAPARHIDPDAPRGVLLHMPVDIRSMSLFVLSALATLAVLRWAAAFFIPVMLGFIFYYALSPIVDAMSRLRIPRALGAGVLIIAILGVTSGGLYSLADDASDLVDSLPQAAQKMRDSMRKRANTRDSKLDTVQKAATELERAAEESSTQAVPNKAVQRVVIEKAHFNVQDYLLSGTVGLATAAAQITLVVFLTYFLLLTGDTYRRKLVKIAGPTLAKKKLTVQALDEINGQIQRYLLVQLVSSVAVGIATGIAFAMLGLKHAAVWGVAAGVLNLIPYIGALAVTAGASVVAFVQFGEVDMALAVGGVSMFIHVISGNLLVPWATSKASRMNPVAVFVGVLAWGWLWGVWGLLLGIPVMMVIKAVCDRVDHLKPVGELLGN